MIYKTINGHTLDCGELDEKTRAFVRRLEDALHDDKVSTAELTVLVHGEENPILDHSGRFPWPAVTPEVFKNPLFEAMGDMIGRKRMKERGTTVEQLAARYTMTPAEFAKEAGVTPGAVRLAVRERRLDSWVVDGEIRLNPASIHSYRTQRKRAEPKASTEAQPLEARIGAVKGVLFRIRTRGGNFLRDESKRAPRGVAAGQFTDWQETATFMHAADDASGGRFIRLAPGDEPVDIKWRGFYLRGSARVVEERTGEAAKAAWAAWKKANPNAA